MDMDRHKTIGNATSRSLASSRYSKRQRRRPEVYDPAQEDLRTGQPDLKVKFKVTQCKGLKSSLGAKQFTAESVWQPSYFSRKLIRELGLSPKYQYSILVFDGEKANWVKLSSLSQLKPDCKIRVYKVKQRNPSPKPEQPKPAAPVQLSQAQVFNLQQQQQNMQSFMVQLYNMHAMMSMYQYGYNPYYMP